MKVSYRTGQSKSLRCPELSTCTLFSHTCVTSVTLYPHLNQATQLFPRHTDTEAGNVVSRRQRQQRHNWCHTSTGSRALLPWTFYFFLVLKQKISFHFRGVHKLCEIIFRPFACLTLSSSIIVSHSSSANYDILPPVST